MLTTLLGTNLIEDLPEYIVTQIKKMLIAHLILLIKTTCTIKKPEMFTKIEQENMEIATTNIKKGKIVVRVITLSKNLILDSSLQHFF